MPKSSALTMILVIAPSAGQLTKFRQALPQPIRRVCIDDARQIRQASYKMIPRHPAATVAAHGQEIAETVPNQTTRGLRIRGTNRRICEGH